MARITFQEEQSYPDGLPIGRWQFGANAGSVRVESTEQGYWVMDRLGSLHRYPYRTLESAGVYLLHIEKIGTL